MLKRQCLSVGQLALVACVMEVVREDSEGELRGTGTRVTPLEPFWRVVYEVLPLR